MPDNEDYERLAWLVNHPRNWTDSDAATARWLVANQRSAVDAMHPNDVRGRQSAQKVIDELEAAIEVYVNTRS